jgi:hypothetical protein
MVNYTKKGSSKSMGSLSASLSEKAKYFEEYESDIIGS